MEFIKSCVEPSLSEMRKLSEETRRIIEDVREHGDEAAARYQKKFDQCERGDFRLSRDEIERAYKSVSESFLADLRRAAQNIRAFAEAQMDSIHEISSFSPSPGISLGHRKIPVQSCCCYVPGGSYPLYSTALMLAIPAKIAGTPRVAACSPAMKGR
ncbi:MAG: histidinol dehydrogenase, partial [Synergistaceae bacterium]|nr:histidinol dehydrogenase [Synergistaceae bacterium]